MEQLLTEIKMEVGVLGLVNHLQILQLLFKESFAKTRAASSRRGLPNVTVMFPAFPTCLSSKTYQLTSLQINSRHKLRTTNGPQRSIKKSGSFANFKLDTLVGSFGCRGDA